MVVHCVDGGGARAYYPPTHLSFYLRDSLCVADQKLIDKTRLNFCSSNSRFLLVSLIIGLDLSLLKVLWLWMCLGLVVARAMRGHILVLQKTGHEGTVRGIGVWFWCS